MSTMLALLLVGCAPQLYLEVSDWVPPENAWPTTDELPEEFSGEGFQTGEILPEFVGIDQNGDTFSLWQLYGNVVIVDISTMWCAPCQELANDVEETAQHYADDGVVYLTVLPENVEGAVPSLDDLGLWADNFGIVSGPIVSDANGWYKGAVPNATFPQIMVLERDLTVAARDLAATDAAIREVVNGLIE